MIIPLTPSARLKWLNRIIHGLCALLIILFAEQVLLMPMLVLVLMNALWAEYKYVHLRALTSIISLDLQATQLQLHLANGDCYGGCLQGESYFSSWLTVLNVKTLLWNTHTCIVMPDMMKTADYRALLGYLRLLNLNRCDQM